MRSKIMSTKFANYDYKHRKLLTEIDFKDIVFCANHDAIMTHMIKLETSIDVLFLISEEERVNKRIYTVSSTYTPNIGSMDKWEFCYKVMINKICEMVGQPNAITTSVNVELNYGSDVECNQLAPDSKLYWAKVKPNAIIPTKRDEDAGFDIYPCFEGDYMIIYPHTTSAIPTGIASSCPVGYQLQIEERSSSGSKGMKYSAGVFDSGYRGEWILQLTNTNDLPIVIAKDGVDIDMDCILYPYSKAIFQAVLHNTCNELTSEEITYDELRSIPSERGDGKMGSSGK